MDGLCPVCREAYTGIEPSCQTCNTWRGYPNVILASLSDEQAALNDRYHRALSSASLRGVIALFEAFQIDVRSSKAVLNCSVEFAHFFFSRERSLYATYYQQILGGTRQPAKPENDRHRTAVDALLYGSYASGIGFAALSLDGEGLVSYGPISLQLKDVAIAARATVLEENSFDFVSNHGLAPGVPLPRGYMTPWQQRDLLACVKVEPLLSVGTESKAFPALLLSSSGDRKRDSYMEVHIYGSFNCKAVERVLGPRSMNRPLDQALLGIVKELAEACGATWEEV